MKLLLDTHIVLAVVNEQTAKFPANIRALLADHGSEFFVSVASLWEIAIKSRLGKLALMFELKLLPEMLTSGGLVILPIKANHVLDAANPEPITRDPFDRLLLAQCLVEDLRLITVDRALASHRMSASQVL